MLEKRLRGLPALSETLTKVLKETDKHDPNLTLIEDWVSRDAGLASKFLRVVNSAYYGLPGQVKTLGHAVMILGLQQVRNLVLSVGALSAFEPKTAKHQQTLRLFWLHSFAAAASAQAIASRAKLPDPQKEAAFTGGLLHDLGNLFTFSEMGSMYDVVLDRTKKEPTKLLQFESETYGMHHAEIGGFIARHWNLPTELVTMIDLHEGPFDGEDIMPAIIHLADTVTRYLYLGENFRDQILPNPAALLRLGYSDADWEQLKSQSASLLASAEELYGQLAA
jgi:HD-like signal output (HDOD) protein